MNDASNDVNRPPLASRPLAALALTLQMGWRKLIYFQFFAKCIASDQASPPLQMEHCRVIMPPRQGVRSELGDQQKPGSCASLSKGPLPLQLVN